MIHQLLTESKENRSSMLKTINTPSLLRQQFWVIVLYLSCPAVSHICSFSFVPSMFYILYMQFIPMVIIQFSTNLPSLYLKRILLLPTPESPMIIIFCKQSYYSFQLFCFFIIKFKKKFLAKYYKVTHYKFIKFILRQKKKNLSVLFLFYYIFFFIQREILRKFLTTKMNYIRSVSPRTTIDHTIRKQQNRSSFKTLEINPSQQLYQTQTIQQKPLNNSIKAYIYRRPQSSFLQRQRNRNNFGQKDADYTPVKNNQKDNNIKWLFCSFQNKQISKIISTIDLDIKYKHSNKGSEVLQSYEKLMKTVNQTYVSQPINQVNKNSFYPNHIVKRNLSSKKKLNVQWSHVNEVSIPAMQHISTNFFPARKSQRLGVARKSHPKIIKNQSLSNKKQINKTNQISDVSKILKKMKNETHRPLSASILHERRHKLAKDEQAIKQQRVKKQQQESVGKCQKILVCKKVTLYH